MQQELFQLIQKMEGAVIDPVEFGEIKGAVAALSQRMQAMETRQAAMDGKLDQVLAKLSEARGGWKTLMALGGTVGAVSSAITWVAAHWKGAP